MDLNQLSSLKQLLLKAIALIDIQLEYQSNFGENEWGLTKKQELFCELYTSDREFFGNGTQAYIEAYNVNLSKPNAYNSAAASASRLLMNVKILQRINEWLEEGVLNDINVDKQLGFWLTQKAHPQAAVAAIKEYNALKQRVTKKLDVMSDGQPLKIALVEFVGDDGSITEN